MSLPPPKVQMSLFDVSMLLEQLFPEANRYRIFNETILPRLWAKRDALCELYCEEDGRPAIEPVIVTAVTLLQFMEKGPDRRAAENVQLHLGWKYALGLEVDYGGFHYSSLCHFRGRLLESAFAKFSFFSGIPAPDRAKWLI